MWEEGIEERCEGVTFAAVSHYSATHRRRQHRGHMADSLISTQRTHLARVRPHRIPFHHSLL